MSLRRIYETVFAPKSKTSIRWSQVDVLFPELKFIDWIGSDLPTKQWTRLQSGWFLGSRSDQPVDGDVLVDRNGTLFSKFGGSWKSEDGLELDPNEADRVIGDADVGDTVPFADGREVLGGKVMPKDTKGTVGTLNSLATYRRYLHGELTTNEFQTSEGGYTVTPVENRRDADEKPQSSEAPAAADTGGDSSTGT